MANIEIVKRTPGDDETEIGLLFSNEPEICVLDIPVNKENEGEVAKDN